MLRIQFPKGMDANEYAQKMTPVHKSLEVVIRNAVWLGKGNKEKAATKEESEPPAAKEEELTEVQAVDDSGLIAASELSQKEEEKPVPSDNHKDPTNPFSLAAKEKADVEATVPVQSADPNVPPHTLSLAAIAARMKL